MLYSRIEGAAVAANATIMRVDAPTALPDEPFDLVLVDWASRAPGWAPALRSRGDARTILFGPHTDLAAHAEAREAGLGPMWARSKLVASLDRLLGP